MTYSILEQHLDGSWWYHPGFSADTIAAACEKPSSWMLETRPVVVVEHFNQFPQMTLHSFDMDKFCLTGSNEGFVWMDCKEIKRLNKL